MLRTNSHLLLETLFVQEQGTYLGLSSGRVEVRCGKTVLQSFPGNWIKQIVLSGRCTMTSGMIEHCVVNRVPVIFMTAHGRYRGRLHSRPYPSLHWLRRQWRLHKNSERCLRISCEMVKGKLANQRRLLLLRNRHRRSDFLAQQAEVIRQMHQAIQANTTLEALRGYEGKGAVAYFDALYEFVPPEFQFQGRNRRPPKDPINALLSWGYTLLFQFVESMILAYGLHPSLGCYHTRSNRYSCLAADLMEEFRSPLVDTLALNLVNLRRLQVDDFDWRKEGDSHCYLKPEARRLFLEEYSQQLMRRFPHPGFDQPVSLAACIAYQVRRYREILKQPETPYEPFIWQSG